MSQGFECTLEDNCNCSKTDIKYNEYRIFVLHFVSGFLHQTFFLFQMLAMTIPDFHSVCLLQTDFSYPSSYI